MLLLEDASADLDSAETELQTIEAAWNADQAALRAEQNQLALALHSLIQLRKERAALIQPATLSTYEKIAKRKHGIGIASVEYSKCMACRVTVPANQIRLAQQGQLIICSSCGRILNPAG
jgi:predicted  nucleic acid-binding Zn-ribbon protein